MRAVHGKFWKPRGLNALKGNGGSTPRFRDFSATITASPTNPASTCGSSVPPAKTPCHFFNATKAFTSMEPSTDYAELICRSNYSFLRGASFPEEIVAQAVKLGLKGLALTDKDGVYGI